MGSGIRKDGIGKSFTYQFLYQIVILVIPLVVSPYLTRVVGSKALGIYTYINSIATYFIMFANLGISRYGQRVIARCSNNEEELRHIFWSLYAVHAIISCTAIVLYYCFSKIIGDDSTAMYYIQGLKVVAALFDVTWLFYGVENFKSVVIRNTIARLTETILIFVFVKGSSDVIYLAMIYSAGSLIGQLIMIPKVVQIAHPIKINRNETLQHFKPVFFFAISVIAVSLYTLFDKILLGWLTIKDNVAYYEYAEKLISLPKTFIIIIGTVMFPRSCILAAKGDIKGQKRYLHYSLNYCFLIGFAAMFGFLAISEKLAFVYYGPGFVESGRIMISMSALPLIVGLGDIIRTQYMIPNGLDKQFIFCVIMNAVINLILSATLIPIIGIYGAVVGTCSAEIFGCVYQMCLCRKYINIIETLKMTIPFLTIGIIMFVCLKIILSLISDITWFSVFLVVLLGATIYLSLAGLYIFKREKDMWNDIIRKLKA